MKRLQVFLMMTLTLIGTSMTSAKKKTVHTIGDSTMATYDTSTSDKVGWGQVLQQFFLTDSVTVNNRAKSGSSSKSFYLESAYWRSVKSQISAGDYVLIQFAHNDEKTNGADGDSLKAYYLSAGDSVTAAATDYRGTTAFDTYKKYLRAYVNETRALGATPILVAPICRKYFSGGDITRKGRHDLGDSFSLLKDGQLLTAQSVDADDDTYDYPYQMRQVAEEMDVPFIDLTTATADMYISYGNDYCTSTLFCSGDNTHTAAVGANLIARRAAQLMQEQAILPGNYNLTSEFSVSPSTQDFGEAYIGQTVTKEFAVSAFDITPSEGTVTITATEPFSVSLSKDSAYARTVTFSYTGGNITFNKFYVRCLLTEAGTINGVVTATNGTEKDSAELKATSVTLTGGTTATAYWRLESNTDYTLDGPATVIDETFSEMYAKSYAEPKGGATTWPDGYGITTDDKHKMQRNCIVGDAWPGGEIDEVSTRYIQFGLKAASGTTLNIDSIGCFIAGSGGSGMRCRVSYSTSDDFADPHVIAEYAGAMTANTVYAVEATPVVRLPEGETIYLRFYPWYTSSATGKTFCISDLTLRGVATTATGIAVRDMTMTAETAFFSPDGRRYRSPLKGLNIVRTGNETKKIIY